MALQLSALITRVRQNTGRNSTTTTPDTQITAYLNDAQLEIARRSDWKDLHITQETTLVAGTYRYAFPPSMKDCISVQVIDDESGTDLIEKTKRWLDRYVPDPENRATGKPNYYAVDGNYFELYPSPDSAYTLKINMRVLPTNMAQDADLPTVDAVDDCIIAFATSELFASIGRQDESMSWERRFERRLKSAKVQDRSRPNYSPQPVPSGLPDNYWNRPDIGLR